MTISFMGGEMGAFVPSDSTVRETTSTGLFNSSFARAAMQCSGTIAFADSASFTAVADSWTMFDLRLNGATTTSTKHRIIEWLDDSDVAWIRLTADYAVTSISNFSFEYWTGSAWTAIGTVALSVNALQTFHVHVVGDSATGSADLYVSNTRRIASGSIDLSGFAGVAKVRQWGHVAGINAQSYVSQVVVSDSSTIGGRLFTVPVTGAGASTDWTGTFANIDEAAYSDADFINSGTANQVSTFGVTAPTLTGYQVLAVGVSARANCGTGGPQNLQLALRSSGTNYFSASKALDAGFGAFVEIWETDPATLAAWVNTAVATLQPGVKSIT